jgi:hypothetical protein
MGESDSRLQDLEVTVERLTAELERVRDAQAVQNLAGRLAYLYEVGDYEAMLEYVAEKTPGVTVEQGARGVFEGFEGARRSMIDVERAFEAQHGRSMRRIFPDLHFEHDSWGKVESELIGTPVVEVAEDGQTARGTWTSFMCVAKAYDTSERPFAAWVWWKTAIDFVKEDGHWKIWHWQKQPLFVTPYDKSWVEQFGPLPVNAANMPPHSGSPDRPPTSAYNRYSFTRDPRNTPAPPAPYETFIESDSYAS